MSYYVFAVLVRFKNLVKPSTRETWQCDWGLEGYYIHGNKYSDNLKDTYIYTTSNVAVRWRYM